MIAIPELKACPFCGGRPFIKSHFNTVAWIVCNECCATGQGVSVNNSRTWEMLPGLAAENWNRRVPSVQNMNGDYE